MVEDVIEDVARACLSVGRDPSSVTIIAASKGASTKAITRAFDGGGRHFGESYLQEAQSKTFPYGATLHFIGALQSNKLKRIAETFDWVHTIAKGNHAQQLSDKTPRPINVLIEVNIADEPQKSGVSPAEAIDLAHQIAELPNLAMKGFMTMGPANQNPESSRPYFIKMRQLLDGVRIPGADCLSMGMSADFEVAVQEGATHVRIGSRIFGGRPAKTE